ncbi:hypothetical protein SALCHL_000030 [Streptomyces albus subsp. chlorinus]|nr:hypothetical protein [Streptomyces albus]
MPPVMLPGENVAPLPALRLVSAALVTGAARNVGVLLAGLARVSWWQHDD